MSPKARTITLNLGALAAAIVGVAGAAWGGSAKVVALADRRYLQADAFAVYQAGEQRQHTVDSLTSLVELREIRGLLAGLDSSDRCRRSQTRFCR